MVFLYGVLALVLSLFTLISLKIANSGKGVYRNLAVVAACLTAVPAGYYVGVFIIELVKVLVSSL